MIAAAQFVFTRPATWGLGIMMAGGILATLGAILRLFSDEEFLDRFTVFGAAMWLLGAGIFAANLSAPK